MSDKADGDQLRGLLLVEDDGGLAHLFEGELTGLGLPVHSVATGREALAWVADHPDCLMVLDYSLPDMTAQELIEAMRQAGGDLDKARTILAPLMANQPVISKHYTVDSPEILEMLAGEIK